ncbi:MAG: hypothetical protein LBI53_01440 [Candidatus Peribacteria bacterium]|jgi:hypothetical protein|nr:hypothetical protein [Candidatus Peribacteria bacterium]
MSGAVGFKNFVKKWTHHTKEQNTHEKNLVRDYDKVTKRMELWRQDMGNNWLGKWIPGKRYKGKRQRELYDQTTQHNFADTKETTDFIMAGLTKLKPTSSAYDKNQYNFAVMEAKARLDMYKQSGHNFLKSNEASKIEQDMRELERALLLVVQRE